MTLFFTFFLFLSLHIHNYQFTHCLLSSIQVMRVRLKVKDTGKRPVVEGALKVIERAKIQAQSIQRQVDAERQVLQKVGDHPNVVKLYSWWATTENLYFLMELVHGGDLFEVVRKAKRLEPPRVARYVLQISQALDFVHHKGIIYRDLKLENVLLNELTDTVLLADFGLAKDLRGKTATQTICGTVQYMGWLRTQADTLGAPRNTLSQVCILINLFCHIPFTTSSAPPKHL